MIEVKSAVTVILAIILIIQIFSVLQFESISTRSYWIKSTLAQPAPAPVMPVPPAVPPAAEPSISSVPQEPKAETKVLESSNFVSYENTSIGVKLGYPSNFDKLNFGNSIAFYTPLQPNEGLFSEQVGILTMDTLPIESESIEQFFRRQLDDFRSSFPDYILSDGPTSINLDGNPALQAKFASVLDNVEYRLMEIWTINQDKSRTYQIEISIRADKYSSFPPGHILRMINSIQLLDSNTVA